MPCERLPRKHTMSSILCNTVNDHPKSSFLSIFRRWYGFNIALWLSRYIYEYTHIHDTDPFKIRLTKIVISYQYIQINILNNFPYTIQQLPLNTFILNIFLRWTFFFYTHTSENPIFLRLLVLFLQETERNVPINEPGMNHSVKWEREYMSISVFQIIHIATLLWLAETHELSRLGQIISYIDYM